MKTRFWILLFLSIAVVCSGLSIWLLGSASDPDKQENEE